ncbi:MAG TPA: hypothetical protein VFS12_18505, partial [Terriglobia bacterium]|nr:hypothetical protein [Terriglobia bacterium]
MIRVYRFILQENYHPRARFILAVLLACLWSSDLSLSQESSANWSEQVRALAGASRFTEAQQIVKRRMQAYPADLEARGWNAHLLSWTN